MLEWCKMSSCVKCKFKKKLLVEVDACCRIVKLDEFIFNFKFVEYIVAFEIQRIKHFNVKNIDFYLRLKLMQLNVGFTNF